MQYKKIEKENIIRNKRKNINSETTVHTKYNNSDYNIDIDKYTHISHYNGIRNKKNITMCNLIITEEQKKIIENNKGKGNKIIALDNSFPINAKLLSYEIKKINNVYFSNLNIEIYDGQIIPNGVYKIIFKNQEFEVKNLMFRTNEYHENWGYSVYFFQLKKIQKFFLSFKTGIINNEIDTMGNFLNHYNGCVYLIESSKIKLQTNENIQQIIINNDYLYKFQIDQAHRLIHHESIIEAKDKEYILVQAHKIDKKGDCIKSIITDIIICNYDSKEMKYSYEPYHNSLENIKNHTKNLFIFIIGIIFAKYYYNFSNSRKMKNIEKKYNKLESAYKYILKDKYNL